MANYLVQASYTSGSWATQIQNPQNRLEQVNKMFAAKGVKFISGYYAFGEFDLCVIAEGPDNVTTASALIAAAAGGALSKIQGYCPPSFYFNPEFHSCCFLTQSFN